MNSYVLRQVDPNRDCNTLAVRYTKGELVHPLETEEKPKPDDTLKTMIKALNMEDTSELRDTISPMVEGKGKGGGATAGSLAGAFIATKQAIPNGYARILAT